LIFQTLFFDLDGTLLDTAPDFISALNTQLLSHGRDPIPDSAIRASVTNGSAGLIEKGFGISVDHALFDSIREEYLDLYFDNIAVKTALFSGLRQVLDTCAQRNIPWGIVTNKPWKYTSAVLDQLSLLDMAATVICPDHVQQPKPHPEAMMLACSQTSSLPKDCIYIGDHRRDIDAGNAAGMVTIAAGWGYIEADEDINSWNADFTLANSNQLHQLLFNQ